MSYVARVYPGKVVDLHMCTELKTNPMLAKKRQTSIPIPSAPVAMLSYGRQQVAKRIRSFYSACFIDALCDIIFAYSASLLSECVSFRNPEVFEDYAG